MMWSVIIHKAGLPWLKERLIAYRLCKRSSESSKFSQYITIIQGILIMLIIKFVLNEIQSV